MQDSQQAPGRGLHLLLVSNWWDVATVRGDAYIPLADVRNAAHVPFPQLWDTDRKPVALHFNRCVGL